MENDGSLVNRVMIYKLRGRGLKEDGGINFEDCSASY